MYQVTPRFNFMKLLADNRPRAAAFLKGDAANDGLSGTVYFYEVPFGGVLIEAEVFGLPDEGRLAPPVFYAFHMHENGNCSDHFSKTGDHYNPAGVPHPKHAGDMLPLRAGDGYAWMSFYDPNLELYDVIGKSMVIHQGADDFTTQPSGNAGKKIGCGVIAAI